MLSLSKHKDDRWYEVRTNNGEHAVASRLWSMGEALERAVRYLSRPTNNPTPVVILECHGGQSSYSSSDLLVLTRDHDEITIKNAGG
jgi:hypothetical protein